MTAVNINTRFILVVYCINEICLCQSFTLYRDKTKKKKETGKIIRLEAAKVSTVHWWEDLPCHFPFVLLDIASVSYRAAGVSVQWPSGSLGRPSRT